VAIDSGRNAGDEDADYTREREQAVAANDAFEGRGDQMKVAGAVCMAGPEQTRRYVSKEKDNGSNVKELPHQVAHGFLRLIVKAVGGLRYRVQSRAQHADGIRYNPRIGADVLFGGGVRQVACVDVHFRYDTVVWRLDM
jgi:hypothetical protein